jgi:hypothetical protein
MEERHLYRRSMIFKLWVEGTVHPAVQIEDREDSERSVFFQAADKCEP